MSEILKGSADGAILSGHPRNIHSFYKETEHIVRYGSFSDRVIEAKTDNQGNLTLSYARPIFFDNAQKPSNDLNVAFRVQAGILGDELFGVDLSKVKSIRGITFPIEKLLKESGFCWDAKEKIWRRIEDEI